MTQSLLDAAAWPAHRLGDAIDALCANAGIGAPQSEGANPQAANEASAAEDWIAWHSQKRGCQSEAVVISYAAIETELPSCCPAILQLPSGRFLALSSFRPGRLQVATPSGKTVHASPREIARHLAEPLLAPQRSEFENLLKDGVLPHGRAAAALDLLLNETLSGTRFDGLWRLALPSGAPVRTWLGQVSALCHVAVLIAAHASQYFLWILSWLLIGQLSLAGQLDRGWLIAWALLLFTLVPLRLLAIWKQGVLAIGVGGLLKARLLEGALRLRPDELRHQGIGHFLTQAFEAETVESLALSGAIDCILVTIELLASALILGWVSLVLIGSTALTLWAALRFEKRYREWTTTRFHITHDLVEAMTGHRTRLVQQARGEWHETEDHALHQYVARSTSLDRAGAILTALTSRAWLIAGILCLSPSVTGGQESASAIAAKLGGVLLAYSALKRVAGSCSELPAIWNAWKRVAPLFHSAARARNIGCMPVAPRDGNRPLVEADGISFRYGPNSPDVLKACTLAIDSGDRILIEGPSGGGKSTFASLLTGLREPNTGLLLLRGLDNATLGDEQWRRRLASAPQFHENHILTETLAFNLLMGRGWPRSTADLNEAEQVCRELGLGQLLDTMPAGLMQMVGEGGWQLSHGERSRIFIARTLLQNAQLIVLDESFAALDPETLKVALETTLRHAETLVVIAHP